MALARRTGQQSERPAAGAPVAGHGEQACSHDSGREVLLGDADLAALPALADLAHGRQHDAVGHRVHGQRGQGASRIAFASASSKRSSAERSRPTGSASGTSDRSRRGLRGQRLPRGLGRRDPGVDQPLHRPDALLVTVAVEPESALAARRLQKVVAALPRTQRVGPDTGAPAELADADQWAGRRRAFATGQTLDRRFDNAESSC